MADQFIEKVFGHDGLIARFHEAYEYRTGQIEMAERVAEAFANRRHLIVEAGTGTGNTLAYLVPAIAAGRADLVSAAALTNTGTKIARRDSPSRGHNLLSHLSMTRKKKWRKILKFEKIVSN